MKKSLIALLVAGALTACGGGGSSNPDNTQNPPPPVAGSEVGVLSDAEVAGVSYVTSSGVSGVTDAQGRYNFNPGDTVKFTIGAAVLGEVPAKGLLTPIDLAAGNENTLTNLLIVLQSLDDDGDPSNGISIPEAAAKAMPTVDFTAPPETVTASVKTAMAAGGIAGEPKDVTAAKEHFLAQGVKLLAGNIWVSQRDDGVPTMVMRVGENGEILFGEIDFADSDGGPGIEYSRIFAKEVNKHGFLIGMDFDATKGHVDTNGTWGLSDMEDSERIAIDGDIVRVGELQDDDTIEMLPVFTKAINDQTGIAGVWAVDSGDNIVDGKAAIKSHTLTFFNTGHLVVLDPIGLPADDEACHSEGGTGANAEGKPGVELGKYTYDAQTQTLTRLKHNNSGTHSDEEIDTNGCVGMWGDLDYDRDVEYKVTFSADGNLATFEDPADPENMFTAVRLSK